MKAPLKSLINERNKLSKLKKHDENEKKIEVLNRKISEIEALEVHNKIVKKIKQFSDNPEQINMSQMWKIFKKMWPKNSGVLPVAKRNFKGKIVSSQNDLKNLLSREYKDRLRSRPMRPDLKYLKERRKKIFEMKMKIAKANHSSERTMAQLDTALSNLKKQQI